MKESKMRSTPMIVRRCVVVLLSLLFLPRVEAARLLLQNHEGKYGYCDEDGNLAIAFEYDDAEPFAHGVANVRKGSERFYIDESATPILTEWRMGVNGERPDLPWPLSSRNLSFDSRGRAFVARASRGEGRGVSAAWHCIDRTGRVLFSLPVPLETGFRHLPRMRGAHTLLEDGSTATVYDWKGDAVFSAACESPILHEGGVFIARDAKTRQRIVRRFREGCADEVFHIPTPLVLFYDERTRTFPALMRKEVDFSFLDQEGAEVGWSRRLRENYRLLSDDLRYGLIVVAAKGAALPQAGAVDLNGRLVLPTTYDSVGVLDEGLLVCTRKKRTPLGEKRILVSFHDGTGRLIGSFPCASVFTNQGKWDSDGWYWMEVDHHGLCWVSPTQKAMIYYDKARREIVKEAFPLANKGS